MATGGTAAVLGEGIVGRELWTDSTFDLFVAGAETVFETLGPRAAAPVFVTSSARSRFIPTPEAGPSSGLRSRYGGFVTSNQRWDKHTHFSVSRRYVYIAKEEDPPLPVA